MTAKFAFVFPGQGSQSVGMLTELAEHYSSVQQTFAEASEALGYDLWELTQQGPKELLDETQRTQPALLAASVAVWRVWREQSGALPNVMAGHSLGEYSALVCSGVLDFKEAIRLVAKRGEYMQAAVPAGEGAMAAIIGLDNEKVASVCQQISGTVAPANYNSVGQVVISGAADAVQQAMVAAKEAGAKIAKQLAVSVPSHSDLMRPAATQLAEDLQKLTVQTPQIPVVNNVDVEAANTPEAIEHALVRQLYSPVRWVESVERMIREEGVTAFIECGPGKVLSGLIKRIDKSVQILAMSDAKQLSDNLALFKN